MMTQTRRAGWSARGKGGPMGLDLLKRFAQRLRSGPVAAGAPRWRAPVLLDRGRLGEARLALDDRGRGLALWENEGNLWSLPMGPGASPAMLRLPFGEGAHPRLALSPEGRGLAVWLADLGEERQILGRPLGSGGSEQEVFRTTGTVRGLQVSVDRRGNALVVWLHEKVGRIEVMTRSFDTRRMAWEAGPTVLGLPADPEASPHLAANPRGHAMVLWEARDGPFEGLVASHHWPADRIWSDRPMPVVGHSVRNHQVAMDGRGNALALWIHAPYGQRARLLASFYEARAGTWCEPVALASAQEISSPRLVMNGNGEGLATWCQRESGAVSQLSAKAFDNRTWKVEPECLDHDRERVHDYAIDLGEDGRAGFLVIQRGEAGDQVLLRTRQGTWSEPKVMAAPQGTSCASPRIAVCPQGMSLMWIQGTGTDQRLVLVDSH